MLLAVVLVREVWLDFKENPLFVKWQATRREKSLASRHSKGGGGDLEMEDYDRQVSPLPSEAEQISPRGTSFIRNPSVAQPQQSRGTFVLETTLSTNSNEIVSPQSNPNTYFASASSSSSSTSSSSSGSTSSTHSSTAPTPRLSTAQEDLEPELRKASLEWSHPNPITSTQGHEDDVVFRIDPIEQSSSSTTPAPTTVADF